MARFLNNYPHTDEGAKLELTQEQEDFCKVVYKLDNEGGATFAGFWNPAKEYSDEYAVVPIRSIYCGTDPIQSNTEFANVLGSSSDSIPEGYKYWLKLWVDKANEGKPYRDCCCTDHSFYSPANNTKYTSVYYDVWNNDLHRWDKTNATANCSGNLVGGHIIKSKSSSSPSTGDDVYILPICDKHNRAHITEKGGWGDGFYMIAARRITAVKLMYLLKNVNDYIV